VLSSLDAQMREAAELLEFERAAKLRDQLAAARKAIESQEMVLSRADDLDIVGLAEDDLEAAFQVFFVRRGRVMGRRGWVVDKVEDIDAPGLVASFLRELYMDRDDNVPPRVLVPAWPADQAVLEEWLSTVRGYARPDQRAGPGRRPAPPAGGRTQRQGGVRPPQAEARLRLRLPVPGPAPSSATSWACPSPRSGSSATTSRTSARPTRSRPWSCSKTASRSERTTESSRSRAS